MKLFLGGLTALAVGAAIGVSITWFELNTFEYFAAQPPGVTLTTVDSPKVRVVEGETVYFGSMPRDTTRKQTFTFKNVGGQPLTLQAGETTCKCTFSDLAEGKVKTLAPGEATPIVLEWTPKSFAAEFTQSAAINTNDPERPIVRLMIHGRVTQPVRPDPADVVFSNISADEGKTALVRLWSEGHPRLALERWETLDPAAAGQFEVRSEPLSEEELRGEPGAKSGLRLSITAKSGLPLGPFHQTIRLATNDPAAPSLELPMHGHVVSDILVTGAKYHKESNELKLGIVKKPAGAEAELRLIVKGPHRGEVKFAVDAREPAEVVFAELGASQSLNNGKTILHTLRVWIPAGAATVNRLSSSEAGAGKVVLSTTHPRVKHVEIQVAFAIEE